MGDAEFMQWLNATNIVIGLILSVTGALTGLIVWIHRRMRSVAEEANVETRKSRHSIDERLGKLERDLKGTQSEVHDMNARIGGLERTLETVARSDDLARLSTQLAELRGSVTSDLRAVIGQIDTLYKAALRSGAPGGKQ